MYQPSTGFDRVSSFFSLPTLTLSHVMWFN